MKETRSYSVWSSIAFLKCIPVSGSIGTSEGYFSNQKHASRRYLAGYVLCFEFLSTLYLWKFLQMVARYIVPLIACLLLSVLTWGLVEKVRPNFGAVLLEDEGRQKGGFSTEMHDAYRFEKLKCNSVSFGIWGACLAGFTGFFGNPHAKRRWLGLLIGLVLGALSGPLGAYLGQLQELRTEYSGASATYWIIRWGAIAGPMGVAAAIAAAMSGFPKIQLVECVLGGILGIAIGVVSISLLHGAITQLEKPENIFPGWTANRVLAVFCVNISVFAMILVQAGRHGSTSLPNNMKTVDS